METSILLTFITFQIVISSFLINKLSKQDLSSVNETGEPGVVGPLGAQGPQGNVVFEQGIQGPIGEAGIRGAIGARGFTGAQGTYGYQGTQGYSGFQGFQGPKGYQATLINGARGLQGPKGFQGQQGGPGPNGSQGSQGLQGLQGPTSLDLTGFQGTNGYQGNPGFIQIGPQGFMGPQTTGTQGAQGLQGSTGPSSHETYIPVIYLNGLPNCPTSIINLSWNGVNPIFLVNTGTVDNFSRVNLSLPFPDSRSESFYGSLVLRFLIANKTPALSEKSYFFRFYDKTGAGNPLGNDVAFFSPYYTSQERYGNLLYEIYLLDKTTLYTRLYYPNEICRFNKITLIY